MAAGRSPLCTDVSSSLPDRKGTRLNSSHSQISYAVFCLKKKKDLPTRTPGKHIKYGQHADNQGDGTATGNVWQCECAPFADARARRVYDPLFFFNDTAPTEIYTLSLHDALPIRTASGGSALRNVSNSTHGSAPPP